MSLWDRYKKMIDRRVEHFGKDEMIVDAMIDAETAAVFDCGTLDMSPGSVIDGPDHADEFFLPFPSVAVEWKAEVDGERVGELTCLFGSGYGQADVDLLHRLGSGFMLAQSSDENPHLIRLIKGHLCWKETHKTAALTAQLYSVCVYEVRSGRCLSAWTEDPKYASESTHITEEDRLNHVHLLGHVARAATRAIEQANSPANWVVQVVDEHARVVKRRGKRTEERRTRYIVVPDRDLDRVVRLPNEGGDHIERSPHRRRAHWRKLNSDRFRLKRGQKVYVKECWVGPKESVHGGERYVVLTSLPGRAAS
jgi:hypothetical protein